MNAARTPTVTHLSPPVSPHVLTLLWPQDASMSAELGSRRALRLPTQLALLDGNLYIAATGSNQVGTRQNQVVTFPL